MNRLGGETSPYLLQHRDNPVEWWPWGPEALATARREGKPILLSVGYAACHWCHVMAHESFESQDTAAAMNALFVNIKVDREERPDIDAIYMNALHLLGQRGGWPLTMFLTPEGRPFWGGTYFPDRARYGQPAFVDVLRRVREVYDQDPAAVAQNADAIMRALEEESAAGQRARPLPGMDRHLAQELCKAVDPVHGGLQGAPKFPQAAIFKLIWRAWRKYGETAAREAVLVTLKRMAQGGIYDHLGGGFARYSTDEIWLAPHFEKMLYDNAQLIELYAQAHAETAAPLFQARIAETVAWLEREMIAAGGGFAATLDADSEGEEGKFYVWDEAEIDAVLGAESPVFKAAYDVTKRGNWEHHTILNRTKRPELGDEAHEARLAAARAKLLAARAARIRPGWDDKVLADWNGLTIAALARAACQFERPQWLALARRAYDFVVAHMTVGGRLCHAARAGRLQKAAMLDDYAGMIGAALALCETTGDPACLAQAQAWCGVLDRHYWDTAGGGYFFTADDAEALIVRQRHARDNATPSGNGMMAANLARLWHLTGEAAWRDRAEATIGAFAGELRKNAFGLCSLIEGFSLLTEAVQVAVIGRRGEESTERLLRAVWRAPQPLLVLSAIEPGSDLPSTHPARGKTQIAARPTAYVCVGQACSLPVTAPESLANLLTKPDPLAA
ncbi:MAG: thioredoxin domain-containing protein [Alphaproteobacteria bacterium]|nr:thioredoxin domain-containing protein [Alphaproteobacteria bacterium]